jgi:dipeptidyl aminopeptidase/acylaminoacyl peptidase
MQKILALFLLSIAFNTIAQTKRPITHEDLIALKRVTAPALSPDGKWAIIGVNELNYNEKEQINDIWIVPTDGSQAPRRLTTAKAGESAYDWSPNGKYISFIAKRDGDEEAQLYLLNMTNGGDAQRFTNILSGVGSPKWSPDGKKIMFTSKVYPGCYNDSTFKKMAETKKNQKYKARIYEGFPIRDFDKWIDEKQSHLFVQNIDSTKAFDFTSKMKNNLSPYFKIEGTTWSSNMELVYAASNDTNLTFHYPKSQIFRLNIESGIETQISNGNTSYTAPKVSSDGKYLYCTTLNGSNEMYELDKLTRYDYPSLANKIVLNTQLDRPINDYKIDESSEIIASIEDQGRDRIVKFTNGGKSIKNLTVNTKGCYTGISTQAGITVALFESSIQPAELVRINKDGSHTALSSFNSDLLNKLDLNEIETIWTKTKKGKNIRSIITKPANFDQNKKYPLLVLMHGGPSVSTKENFTYRWNNHLIAQKDIVVIMTDYTGSTGYGEKFGKDIQNDPFKGPAEEIQEAATDAIKRFNFIDGTNQAAAGASYGGHLANWMQATTSHYKCLIAHAGLVNSVSQWGTSDGIYGRELMNGGTPWSGAKTWSVQNPYTYISNFKTPILLSVGENDFRVPINNTIENYHILQRLKIPSRLIVFPEENHWILKPENSRLHYKEINNWLRKWLLIKD